jgi:hypothetical protein
VIGDGAGRHAEFGDSFGQLVGPAGAVEEGVFGVEVEVSERHLAFGRTTNPTPDILRRGDQRRTGEFYRDIAVPGVRSDGHVDSAMNQSSTTLAMGTSAKIASHGE